MNTRRLLKLAEFLDNLPRKRFDIRSWSSSADLSGCGSSACALGWATTIPSFKRAGLRLHMHPFNRVEYKGAEDFSAARLFFGFESERATSQILFYGFFYSSNPTPKQVAKRIRLLVKLGEAKFCENFIAPS